MSCEAFKLGYARRNKAAHRALLRLRQRESAVRAPADVSTLKQDDLAPVRQTDNARIRSVLAAGAGTAVVQRYRPVTVHLVRHLLKTGRTHPPHDVLANDICEKADAKDAKQPEKNLEDTRLRTQRPDDVLLAQRRHDVPEAAVAVWRPEEHAIALKGQLANADDRNADAEHALSLLVALGHLIQN